MLTITTENIKPYSWHDPKAIKLALCQLEVARDKIIKELNEVWQEYDNEKKVPKEYKSKDLEWIAIQNYLNNVNSLIVSTLKIALYKARLQELKKVQKG